ncbi:MAG: hypothetical protein LKE54_07325 [Prevotella sp.]|nr:hypothetical protein [Prevotella sp.]MCH3994844.1 hypothetical protein [Prevotella sp.]
MKKVFIIEGVKVDFTDSDAVTVNGEKYTMGVSDYAEGMLGLEDYEKYEIFHKSNKDGKWKVYGLDKNYTPFLKY